MPIMILSLDTFIFLKLGALLPQSPECWDYKHVPLYPASLDTFMSVYLQLPHTFLKFLSPQVKDLAWKMRLDSLVYAIIVPSWLPRITEFKFHSPLILPFFADRVSLCSPK
jgi:hypothetical protein